jgi:hypothetical protein
MYNHAVQGEYHGAEQEAKLNKEQKIGMGLWIKFPAG